MAMLRSLLLLFTVFSMGNAEVEKCPSGWTKFGDRRFKFFSQLVNWVTAERNCQSLDANLASVHNKLENNFLINLLPSFSTPCWIGAHDGEQEGEWLWSDGTPYFYNNWCSVEPNNLGSVKNCGGINWTSNHCWNDRDCSNLIGYVCAKDL